MTSVAQDIPRSAVAESFKVLIVDDDEDARAIVQAAVTRLGYSCEVACDGLEAYAMHTLNRADIIISDWKMPRMGGLELCVRVRADDSARPYVHFIFFSGNRDDEYARAGMRAGADEYLVKPVDLDELESRLAAASRGLLQRRAR